MVARTGNFVPLGNQYEGFFRFYSFGSPVTGVGQSFTLTVTIPSCQTRDQELAYAEYACRAAARQVRASGGQPTHGTILAQPNTLPGVPIVLATYVYAPFAPS